MLSGQIKMDEQLEGLKWVVRALAQPAHVQKELFPPFVFIPDELLLEFEQFFEPDSARYTDEWSGAQYLSLRALDRKFEALDASGREELWDDQDSLDLPEWSEVRQLAREVIRAFGWPTDKPPSRK